MCASGMVFWVSVFTLMGPILMNLLKSGVDDAPLGKSHSAKSDLSDTK
jgi:hypothetical protein